MLSADLSKASSRSSQSQQQAATWLRSPRLFTYSQQHRLSPSSSSSVFLLTLAARFFMSAACEAAKRRKAEINSSHSHVARQLSISAGGVDPTGDFLPHHGGRRAYPAGLTRPLLPPRPSHLSPTCLPCFLKIIHKIIHSHLNQCFSTFFFFIDHN